MTKPSLYIHTCISVTGQDLDHADHLVDVAKAQGWTAVTRSDLIRWMIRHTHADDIPDSDNGGKLAGESTCPESRPDAASV